MAETKARTKAAILRDLHDEHEARLTAFAAGVPFANIRAHDQRIEDLLDELHGAMEREQTDGQPA